MLVLTGYTHTHTVGMEKIRKKGLENRACNNYIIAVSEDVETRAGLGVQSFRKWYLCLSGLVLALLL